MAHSPQDHSAQAQAVPAGGQAASIGPRVSATSTSGSTKRSRIGSEAGCYRLAHVGGDNPRIYATEIGEIEFLQLGARGRDVCHIQGLVVLAAIDKNTQPIAAKEISHQSRLVLQFSGQVAQCVQHFECGRFLARNRAVCGTDFCLQFGVLNRGRGADYEFVAFSGPFALLEFGDSRFQGADSEPIMPFGLPASIARRVRPAHIDVDAVLLLATAAKERCPILDITSRADKGDDSTAARNSPIPTRQTAGVASVAGLAACSRPLVAGCVSQDGFSTLLARRSSRFSDHG